MSDYSDYELEREANIAKNRALLADLDVTVDLPPVKKQTKTVRTSAKPVQPAKRTKREREAPAPARQSARLRKPVVDPNESPAKKRKREKEEEERRAKEEEERLEAEEQARQAKKPRHHELDLLDVTEELDPTELAALRSTFSTAIRNTHPRRVGGPDDVKDKAAIAELREKLGKLKVVSRAKVTQDRVYSAAYHPDPTKDLIFFGDKHGQLGIWDAQAPSDEIADADGEVSVVADEKSGKSWRLQVHWPATSHSSISNIKFDPTDSHSVYTSSYDCTVFSMDDALITCIDLPVTGSEMWISDAEGGLTHLDLREDKSKARWFQVSNEKVGSVSVNPTAPHYLVTASNSRAMRIWDTRKLQNIGGDSASETENPNDFNQNIIEEYLGSPKGKGCLRADWQHGKSVSSAYWDPSGKSVLSTCYDDLLRLWEFSGSVLKSTSTFPSSRPSNQIRHSCQTGRWVTVFKAQWSPNPDYYPHFTVGNMERSLDIYSGKGELVARLADRTKISAVQAVTCSHPNVLERVASGNASGRCVLWAPADM
ncbi:WD40-repeat-containing domain protein [Fomitopsis serialis]|uniref:WD40-repeat-containing domain protein n=1 Tax=Fomitopsis serialis TaxID=139415 RepID=UPI00200799FF|nr:WD40-repeat-containing domain protein [Neoantrodia serialis]KAH9934672.1 WD40-repeat-containing domain protein [Neoantrodia serialis]